MRPSATSACGLKLLVYEAFKLKVYEALSYWCMTRTHTLLLQKRVRPSNTFVVRLIYIKHNLSHNVIFCIFSWRFPRTESHAYLELLLGRSCSQMLEPLAVVLADAWAIFVWISEIWKCLCLWLSWLLFVAGKVPSWVELGNRMEGGNWHGKSDTWGGLARLENLHQLSTLPLATLPQILSWHHNARSA
jgi:hypothetical protein